MTNRVPLAGNMAQCPKCGRSDRLNEYVGMCEFCYHDNSRSRYYVGQTKSGEFLVMQEIPGNSIIVCHTVHGRPDAEMVVDALNAWQNRHKNHPKP